MKATAALTREQNIFSELGMPSQATKRPVGKLVVLGGRCAVSWAAQRDVDELIGIYAEQTLSAIFGRINL